MIESGDSDIFEIHSIGACDIAYRSNILLLLLSTVEKNEINKSWLIWMRLRFFFILTIIHGNWPNRSTQSVDKSPHLIRKETEFNIGNSLLSATFFTTIPEMFVISMLFYNKTMQILNMHWIVSYDHNKKPFLMAKFDEKM